MEEKNKSKQITFGTYAIIVTIVFLVLLVGILAGMLMQKNKEERVTNTTQNVTIENKIDKEDVKKEENVVTNNKITNEETTSEEIKIPEASTNISKDEEKIISNYFKGVWITDNGEKLLAIDYGKRFCDINKSINSKEYGTYTVKDGTSSSVPTITLTYTSGKILELELTQGSDNYLMSNDRKVQYVEYEGYYFGVGEGDEGIFDDEKSIPSASTNITEKEEKTISDYFKGTWITSNGEKLLVVDYGKRFCDINSNNNSREYGTYTVTDETEPTIKLTYASGKIVELKLTQGGANYLISDNSKVKYVEYEGYYFGANEGDEGIFNK